MGRIRIGVSGWDYDSWWGSFYPDDHPARHDPRLRRAEERQPPPACSPTTSSTTPEPSQCGGSHRG